MKECLENLLGSTQVREGGIFRARVGSVYLLFVIASSRLPMTASFSLKIEYFQFEDTINIKRDQTVRDVINLSTNMRAYYVIKQKNGTTGHKLQQGMLKDCIWDTMLEQ